MKQIEVPLVDPMLAAHFPGHALLPGAALLDQILHVCAAPTPCRVTAKFLSPVRPGDVITVALLPASETGLHKFEASVAGAIVCSGHFKP